MSDGIPSTRGFQGAVTSLALVDVIQLQAGNRFSGLISVSSAGRIGRLYFVDGAIVHAQTPDAVGESAVHAIVSWPEGSFQLHPNTATLERTIEKSVSHLLIEAHQYLDEGRRAPLPAPSVPSPARMSFVDRVRAIAGVADAVRFGRDGVPVGDTSPRAEALAAKGLYLAMTHGAMLNQAFNLGELASVSVKSDLEPMLLFQSHGWYLCVAVAAAAANDEVEARLRALFSRQGAK